MGGEMTLLEYYIFFWSQLCLTKILIIRAFIYGFFFFLKKEGRITSLTETLEE